MAAKAILALVAVIVAVIPQSTSNQNLRPIIGILSQSLSNGMKRVLGDSNYSSYIAASYVKYIESGGARVIPVLINQKCSYYSNIVDAVNGLVFPGGSSSITQSSGYGRAGRILYDLVKEKANAGVEIPLMTMCLGFEMLLYLEANNSKSLVPCKAKNRADPLILEEGWQESQLLGGAPMDVIETLTNSNSTSNFHKYCVTNDTFFSNGLDAGFIVLSTSHDDDDLEYISTVEHRHLPIYGFQWHPEKNLFEWSYDSIPHNREAIRSSQYFTNLFIDKARLNHQKFASKEEEQQHLIYNYKTIYVGRLYASSFQECYLFQ